MKNNDSITLYAQWKPLRIVLAGFADSVVDLDNLKYEVPTDEAQTDTTDSGTVTKTSPYIREGDTMTIDKSGSTYTVVIKDSNQNVFMKFTSTRSVNIPTGTFTYDQLLLKDWTASIMNGVPHSRYFPLKTLYPSSLGNSARDGYGAVWVDVTTDLQ